MEAEAIRELLSSPSDKIKEVAEKVELPLPIAREMRVQALFIVLGKCVLCMSSTSKGLCATCKRLPISKPLLRTTRARLLKSLDPDSVLITRQCDICDNRFNEMVGEVLWKIKKFHRYDPAKTCRGCRSKKKRLSFENKSKQQKAKRAEGNEKQPLLANPFKDSQMLQELRPTLPKNKRRRKASKK